MSKQRDILKYTRKASVKFTVNFRFKIFSKLLYGMIVPNIESNPLWVYLEIGRCVYDLNVYTSVTVDTVLREETVQRKPWPIFNVRLNSIQFYTFQDVESELL